MWGASLNGQLSGDRFWCNTNQLCVLVLASNYITGKRSNYLPKDQLHPHTLSLWQLWSGSLVPRPIEHTQFCCYGIKTSDWVLCTRAIVLKYGWCLSILLCESSSLHHGIYHHGSHHHGSCHHGSCHHGNIIETHESLGAHSSYRFFPGGLGWEEGMYSVCKGRMGSSEHLLEFCRF